MTALPRGTTVMVDGLRTHYLESGIGPAVVLLHSGEYGGSSELTWEFNLTALAGHFRVIAPDWLGFGQSEKIYDFQLGLRRSMLHLRRFLETLGVFECHFVGASMGGTLLARTLGLEPRFLKAKSLTLIGAGGGAPDNDHRRALLTYDCTLEGMRSVVAALFHDPRWAEDEGYVAKRHLSSMIPGAWECSSAPRFKNPTVPKKTSFSQADDIAYENISCPVLIIGGARDKLKMPGYAVSMQQRLPNARTHIFENCGHLANIERAAETNDLIIDFISSVEEERSR